MGWDGAEWHGTGRDEMGWGGIGWDGTERYGPEQDGKGGI